MFLRINTFQNLTIFSSVNPCCTICFCSLLFDESFDAIFQLLESVVHGSGALDMNILCRRTQTVGEQLGHFRNWHSTVPLEVLIIQILLHLPCFDLMWLLQVLPVVHWDALMAQFALCKGQFTTDPLCHVVQFVHESQNVLISLHSGLQFNAKMSRAIKITLNITQSNNILTLHTTMNHFKVDLMAWEILIYKPRGNILTEDLRITVSTMADT